MKTGRPPKPTMLHKLHGTDRADRMRKRAHEPMPEGDLSEPPNWFSDGQLASWRYAIQHAPQGLLKMIDRGMLVMWVEAEDRHRVATITQNSLNERGKDLPFLVRTPEGELVPSPYVEIITQATKVMFRAADAMGFSPVARPRLRVPKAADEDEDDNPWHDLRVIPGGKKD